MSFLDEEPSTKRAWNGLSPLGVWFDLAMSSLGIGGFALAMGLAYGNILDGVNGADCLSAIAFRGSTT